MAGMDAFAPAAPRPPRRLASLGVRRVRLICGLVLFTYAALHFLNHALGNISVAAMDRQLALQKLVWQPLPGAIVLYGALLTHMSLGFWALYERRQFRWTRVEITQLVLGLSIPFLLTDHFVATRLALSFYGIDKNYPQELYSFWVAWPPGALRQMTLLLVVWTHGCIGLHFWLRLKPSYARLRPALFALAVLLPAFALMGQWQGARTIEAAANDPAWRARELTPAHVGAPPENARLLEYRNAILVLLVVTLAGAFAARRIRRWRERRIGTIRLTYPDRSIRVTRGLSILEASLSHNIPHAHVCGGRGRCSTCRIRVLSRENDLPPASAAEAEVLERIAAGPGVRLACQLRPDRDVAFVPLLPASVGVSDLHRGNAQSFGEERFVVIMFVDMRGSSRLAEMRLPYDTVFIINQFLNAVSRGVLAAGGEPNQVLGDGLLALFGLDAAPDIACRQAIAACAAIGTNVNALNLALSYGQNEPVRFGVGINAGMIVAGDIGFERHAQFTVIGDPVNVAARLRDLTKPIGCEVLMSEDVYLRAGFPPDALPAHEVDARGREAQVKARAAALAHDLAVPVAMAQA